MNKELEKSYKDLANEILDFIGTAKWQKATSKYEIYHSMIAKERCFFINNEEIWQGNDIRLEVRETATKAAYFIRDYFLKNQGNRIWELTFTLYPDGKFEIEYDYNKPEDYEETDEVITGDEINQTFLK